MIWQPTDELELRRRWEAGETATTIAAALGSRFTRNAVIRRAHELNLEAKRR